MGSSYSQETSNQVTCSNYNQVAKLAKSNQVTTSYYPEPGVTSLTSSNYILATKS